MKTYSIPNCPLLIGKKNAKKLEELAEKWGQVRLSITERAYGRALIQAISEQNPMVRVDFTVRDSSINWPDVVIDLDTARQISR